MTGSSVQASSFPDLQNKPFSGRETGGQGCSVTASGRNGGQRQLQTNAQAVTRGAPPDGVLPWVPSWDCPRPAGQAPRGAERVGFIYSHNEHSRGI